MEARSQRKVRDGREYDHLFPPADDTDVIVKKSADVEDTLRLIRKIVHQTLWHTAKIAPVLKGKTVEETCSNIWHFVYDHIKYKRDEDGVEQVRSPRRAWADRKTGIDCDCYSVFILSILTNLKIPCFARVTKYRKKYPEVPRWQHVYPLVPLEGHYENYQDDRDHYIVMDCVKDDFNDEQPYLESIDYDMQLNYLDGFDDEDNGLQYETVDAQSIADLYDEDDLGSLKSLVKKVGSAIKSGAKSVGKAVATTAKKVGDAAGKVIRTVNRYANPATILLRNGFLLAMKQNMMNVAGRLRYAYLTDAQAQKLGINPAALSKLRSVKDKAETIYWQAGGLKENLKKGILEGKGNKDKKVPLSGLYGLDEVYADMDEYNILHDNIDGTDGLGEVVSGTALAAASGAVAAVAASLKQIKDLFTKNDTPEAKSFQSESENAVEQLVTSAVPKATPLISAVKSASSVVQQAKSLTPATAKSGTDTKASSLISKATSVLQKAKSGSALVQQAKSLVPAKATSTAPATASAQTKASPSATARTTAAQVIEKVKSTLPKISSYAKSGSTVPADTKSAATPSVTEAGGSASAQNISRSQDPLPMHDEWTDTKSPAAPAPEEKGFLSKTTGWVKDNPGKTLLIAGAIAGSGYLVARSFRGKGSNEVSGLSGTPSRKKRKKRSKRKHTNRQARKMKVQSIKL